MLEARSIAVVGASDRPDSFGQRMVTEALRSPGARVHLINPRQPQIGGRACAPSLAALDEPVDLVLLGVGDQALASALESAAQAGARSAVVFGSAHAPGLREQLRQIAGQAGMALCGAGCMGFINVATGLRALGYLERDPVRPGPVALVTHSGSVFSTLLRTRRAIGFSLAVSSGQELVTSTADYLEYVLDRHSVAVPDARQAVIALVAETIREPVSLRAQLRRASDLDVPVVLLPVGGSPAGSQLVTAHSGAVAGAGAMWDALCDDTGALRVHDLAELTDTLELLTQLRVRSSPGQPRPGRGIATVHDSGAERALTADLAAELGVPFATIGPGTRDRLSGLLDDGLTAQNPLDVWGTGASTRALFRDCLLAMAADPAVEVTALAVDLVPEFDGDTSYADAVLDAAAAAPGPVVVLAGVASAVDDAVADRLRAAGVPVLEGTRSGLVALRNLLLLRERNPRDTPLPDPDAPDAPGDAIGAPHDKIRRARWRARLAQAAPLSGAESFALLADYGVQVSQVRAAATEYEAVVAAARIGYPVVLKTDAAGIAHKSDAGGVLLRLTTEADVRAGYRRLAAAYGPAVLVCEQIPAGIEVCAGIVADPHLGPLLVLAAGGTLIELLGDRVVACPPVSAGRALTLLGRLRIARLLAGHRGAPAADVDALARAAAGISWLAADLGDLLDGLDVNPLIVSPDGAVAADVLVQARSAVQKIE